MEGFTNDELFSQNPVYAHNEPDPGRMFVEIIFENARDASNRLEIAVELLEPHLLEAMLRKTVSQGCREFKADMSGKIHIIFLEKTGNFFA